MTPARMTVLLSAFVMTVLLGPGVVPTQAGTGPHGVWDEILTLLEATPPSADDLHFGAPRPVNNGQAHVNFLNGEIRFAVTGVPFLSGPSGMQFDGQEVGPMVKGTLVCNVTAGAGATLVDTPVVPLTEQGDATFVGQVPLPMPCLSPPHDLAFFVRIAQGGPLSR